jgi:C1A family cysteine protease
MATEGNKTFWRGLFLVIVGLGINTVGNYIYANKTKIKAFFLNLQRQLPDLRDLSIDSLFSPIDESITPLPPTVDLRAKCPPIYDQKQTGSCTGNAGVAARIMLSDLKVDLSRLNLYYNERLLEGDVTKDGGATMRSIGKALQKFGVCEEKYQPFSENMVTVAPSVSANENAPNYKIKAYYGLTTLQQIRQTILTTQKPVLGLIELYDNFNDTLVNGIVPMPKGDFIGNHAILFVGYSDEGKYLIFRNSWGKGFGKDGYGYLPYAYVEQGHSADFWYLEV